MATTRVQWNSKMWRCTLMASNTRGGNYANVYYPSSGLLVADEDYSPEHTTLELKKSSTPNAVRQVSNLKAVIHFSIANTNTGNIIAQATGGQTISGYKNPMVFKGGESNFNTLLRSPNGSGVAWLLINHKAQMGVKTIASISLFRSKEALDDDPVTNMAFEIVGHSPS
ncbi:hypothetical protein ALT_3363 [Aspergillus lentulus]|uniref:Uncharacterized protein n=1 Tax=Aspergillus lentulus TaxID=293939 RepID=A0AAN4PGA6_ASPLE|nr:hypothetical protein ALT_3363 [Aspergillus lentulus]